jgi:hypothetical protein
MEEATTSTNTNLTTPNPATPEEATAGPFTLPETEPSANQVNTHERTNNPQKLLRRWAGKTTEIFYRHLGINPAHDVYEDMLATCSMAFARAYDAAANEATSGPGIREDITPAMAKLRLILTQWRPFLALARVPELPQPSGRLEQVDDLLNYAKQLSEYLSPERRAGSRMTHKQADAFFNIIDPAITTLDTLAKRNNERRADRQAELALARSTAKEFEETVTAYRHTLRTLVGSGHSDVRSITRTRRVASGEVIGSENARTNVVGALGSMDSEKEAEEAA